MQKTNSNNSLSKYTDPYTFKNIQDKFSIMEFEEMQIWYYPPESLFLLDSTSIKHNSHSLPSDVWSLGCICAELILPHPLFSSQNVPDQVVATLSILGLPSDKNDLPSNAFHRDYYYNLTSKKIKKKLLFDYLMESSGAIVEQSTIKLIEWMLCYNPSRRPTVVDLVEILSESTVLVENYGDKCLVENISASFHDDSLSHDAIMVASQSMYDEAIEIASFLNQSSSSSSFHETQMMFSDSVNNHKNKDVISQVEKKIKKSIENGKRSVMEYRNSQVIKNNDGDDIKVSILDFVGFKAGHDDVVAIEWGFIRQKHYLKTNSGRSVADFIIPISDLTKELWHKPLVVQMWEPLIRDDVNHSGSQKIKKYGECQIDMYMLKLKDIDGWYHCVAASHRTNRRSIGQIRVQCIMPKS
ncbi:hypothetical protein AKO1_006635 [Acrasis kona]|uniref:Protein kinase domain-containing protein n=1 Tax=Acrasis kona TaxID=1008807 RepID=A0AAW2ZL90_9EUKA